MSEDKNSISLREYVEIRLELIKEDVRTATIANNERLNLLNESRAQIKDTVDRNITRLEVDDKIKTIDARFEVVNRATNVNANKIANIEGRATAISIGIGIVVVAINIGLHFLK